MSQQTNEPLVEMFLFETNQLLEQLEQILLSSEKENTYSSENINEIFRIMHTIKGSSAMLSYTGLSALAHTMEDLFHYIRENHPPVIRFSDLTDLILKGADFIKTELTGIERGTGSNGDSGVLVQEIKTYLKNLKEENSLSGESSSKKVTPVTGNQDEQQSNTAAGSTDKNSFRAVIFFEDGCQMENIRAYGVIHNLENICCEIQYCPANILEDAGSEEIIRKDGFRILFKTDYSMDMIREVLMQTVFLKNLSLEELDSQPDNSVEKEPGDAKDETPEQVSGTEHDKAHKNEDAAKTIHQSMISVNVNKLDNLMDLVGELVIAESMVIGNPDLAGLNLDNFRKAARQLEKITGELQDTVMTIRMVPLSATFHKMNRIVRDMGKKLNKNVELRIIGEETEVDKNIIDHLSDPLMHLVRNAADHGIEPSDKRISFGKDPTGIITLEAKNSGGDVLINIKDDGNGLDREKILAKARENGLVHKPESDLTDREIYSFIFLPGFSTKEDVSEFSGRGVGMDVVTKNIEKIGGAVSIESAQHEGTTVSIRIPLTLAIIGGMNIKVGNARYTIPTTSIRESFRPKKESIIKDPDGNEMILIRGNCYPIIRLHQHFKVQTHVTCIHEGIIIMIENDSRAVCIFADALLGEQQVVVKALPRYIKKVKGLAGCTLLGNGEISLILDAAALVGQE